MINKIISKNVTNIQLEGEAVCLEFLKSYPYYWIENRSENDVLVSLDNEPVEASDGTYSVLAGSNLRISGGFGQKLVLLGNGTVQVIASDIAESPFKSAAKGGGISLLKYIDILSAGFTDNSDYDGGSLTMIADNNTWSTLRFKKDCDVYVRGGNLTISREDGLIANNVQFTTSVTSGISVTATALDDIPSSFVFPTRYKGGSYSSWNSVGKYEGKHKCTLTKEFAEIPSSIADKWVTGKTFEIEYPPKIPMSFKECFTITGAAENVTGVFCVLINGIKYFYILFNGCFPIVESANSRLNFGQQNFGQRIALTNYLGQSSYGKQELSFSNVSIIESQYLSLNNVDLNNVYFNTKDVCGKTGNTIYPTYIIKEKNCELSDFID